ncbi:hypothetical protein BCEP4_1540030 [Burkholderia cepacia]|nr:hypothetical protein BCEP4_1540030 [Burkholderia cepacia]
MGRDRGWMPSRLATSYLCWGNPGEVDSTGPDWIGAVSVRQARQISGSSARSTRPGGRK